jgi:hypothetical protein
LIPTSTSSQKASTLVTVASTKRRAAVHHNMRRISTDIDNEYEPSHLLLMHVFVFIFDIF